MKEQDDGYVDYRSLISEVTGLPVESLGVSHGDNMLIFTTEQPLGFTQDQIRAVTDACRQQVGTNAVLRFMK